MISFDQIVSEQDYMEMEPNYFALEAKCVANVHPQKINGKFIFETFDKMLVVGEIVIGENGMFELIKIKDEQILTGSRGLLMIK